MSPYGGWLRLPVVVAAMPFPCQQVGDALDDQGFNLLVGVGAFEEAASFGLTRASLAYSAGAGRLCRHCREQTR